MSCHSSVEGRLHKETWHTIPHYKERSFYFIMVSLKYNILFSKWCKYHQSFLCFNNFHWYLTQYGMTKLNIKSDKEANCNFSHITHSHIMLPYPDSDYNGNRVWCCMSYCTASGLQIKGVLWWSWSCQSFDPTNFITPAYQSSTLWLTLSPFHGSIHSCHHTHVTYQGYACFLSLLSSLTRLLYRTLIHSILI